MLTPVEFTVVLRGYSPDQVQALLRQAHEAQVSPDRTLRTAARQALQRPQLAIRFRGYDRAQVERYCTQLAQELAD